MRYITTLSFETGLWAGQTTNTITHEPLPIGTKMKFIAWEGTVVAQHEEPPAKNVVHMIEITGEQSVGVDDHWEAWMGRHCGMGETPEAAIKDLEQESGIPESEMNF